ncbi:hypothetical protein H4S04_003379 [Coemansia sp. S16]|nr:hypothetical protein H4S03_000151 [Coemansia sp. S3946]KAJ2049188.1 hypothetical protein H4S04_003379 [Coemansia sp. S16]KAJ2432176.1 hypothetical protein GGF41_000147 [Coemansia sp. RSA 2531]
MPSGTLRVPLESMASQFTVNEIDAQGSVTLQPHLSAQEEMAQQIGQLWDTYNNFQGLPSLPDTDDTDSDSKSTGDDEEDDAVDLLTTTADNNDESADMDAYMVRAKVHEQLTLAQSEIQVSLDMVRLLLAAKKRAARGDVTSGGQASLAKHDQATGSTAFAALVGGDIGTEVTVGGLPFPVGMVDTVKTERRAQISSEQQTNELKFVLGAKYRQMGEAADTLLLSSQRLQTMARGESGFWRTAFELRRRNWVVQQQRQLMTSKRMPVYGDRYFVRYGYADAGSSFSEDGLAEILRPSDDSSLADDEEDVVMQSPPESSVSSQLTTPLSKLGTKTAPLFIPSSDRRRMQVRLFADEQNSLAGLADSSDYCGSPLHPSALDRTHARLLSARRALFDRELYHRLCKEARVLDLGSVRSTVTSADPPGIHDILVTTLSRDNMDVRVEWMLDDTNNSEIPGNDFVAWQSEYYAGLALVMAAMHQRRLHREVKQYYLGANLASRALVTANSGRAPPPPDAFANLPVVPTSAAQPPVAQSQVATGAATPLAVSAAPSGSETAASGSGSPAAAAVVAGSAESTAAEASVGTTFTVARPDLLILAPVLQGMQFAKWQHILSAHTQRACTAWRQLTGEPIEVITHFARSYQTPDSKLSARDTRNLRQLCTTTFTDNDGPVASSEGMAYVIRMRFQGGSIMAFRVDSSGNLVFIKGYFPPSTDTPTSLPDQISIHRVFRIIPMAGLSEFVDQLRREMQSLVLLRVASALSKCSYQRVGKRCQMGQWYVHQAQLCAVGECWEGARHRQIIAVPCWDEDSSVTGAWRLSLAFGPKHPTVFDAIPPLSDNGSDRPRVPWTTVYPPILGSSMALEISNLKTFEERLLQVLISSF